MTDFIYQVTLRPKQLTVFKANRWLEDNGYKWREDFQCSGGLLNMGVNHVFHFKDLNLALIFKLTHGG